MWSHIRSRILDVLPFAEHTDYFLPKGSISSNSILHNLLDALHFKGVHSDIALWCTHHLEDNWILNASLPNSNIIIPAKFKGIQSACLHFLVSTSPFHNASSISNFQSYFASKIQLTLKSRNVDFAPVSSAHNVVMQYPVNWFHSLFICSQ